MGSIAENGIGYLELMSMLIRVVKSKMLWLGLIFIVLGGVFGAIELEFYQYIDSDGLLHESWFLPLGIISFLFGAIIILFVVLGNAWNYYKGKRNGSKRRGGRLAERQIIKYRDLTRDYSDALRSFTLVLGECSAPAIQVLSRYASEFNLEDSDRYQDSRIVSLSVPVQVIPDLVRELGKNNIAVYQVILS